MDESKSLIISDLRQDLKDSESLIEVLQANESRKKQEFNSQTQEQYKLKQSNHLLRKEIIQVKEHLEEADKNVARLNQDSLHYQHELTQMKIKVGKTVESLEYKFNDLLSIKDSDSKKNQNSILELEIELDQLKKTIKQDVEKVFIDFPSIIRLIQVST